MVGARIVERPNREWKRAIAREGGERERKNNISLYIISTRNEFMYLYANSRREGGFVTFIYILEVRAILTSSCNCVPCDGVQSQNSFNFFFWKRRITTCLRKLFLTGISEQINSNTYNLIQYILNKSMDGNDATVYLSMTVASVPLITLAHLNFASFLDMRLTGKSIARFYWTEEIKVLLQHVIFRMPVFATTNQLCEWTTCNLLDSHLRFVMREYPESISMCVDILYE